MREKYESLPLTSLKEIAKARGLKGVSTMKKADIIELMLKKDEQDKAEEAKEEVKRPFEKADILKEKKSRLNELNKLLNIGENIKTNTWNKRKQELSIAD